MARYIDADKLWNDRPQIPKGKSMDYGAGFSECMWGFSRNIRKQINTESADVVPKSEVEKIFEEIQKIFVHRILHNESQYFEGVLDNITKDFAELKKKYTKEG